MIYVRNVHLWAIIFIITTITILYYNTSAILANDLFIWFEWLKVYEYIYDIQGSLLFIPFLYAFIALGWRGAVVVWILSAGAIYPQIIYFSNDVASLARNIFFSFIPLMVIGLITFKLKWREKDRKILTEREAERQNYMLEVFRAQENERHRIAQELHDDTTQTLLVIASRARSLESNKKNSDAKLVKREVAYIKDAILNVTEDLRRLSLDLRPSLLDNVGLVPALIWLIDRMNQSEKVLHIQLKVEGKERKLKPEDDVNIFRIIQEALNNIRRHSQAYNAWITLKYSPNSLKITIRDNGVGFSLPKEANTLSHKGKLGLTGIRHRAEFLDGKLRIRSGIGKGTSISLEVNIPKTLIE